MAAKRAVGGLELESCIVVPRITHSGQLVITQQCRVKGTLARLIIVDGVVAGLTGNPTLDDARRLQSLVGQSASGMSGYVPM